MIEYFLFARESTDMERYRSGHNEAVLKTVCPKGRVGSNPTLSAQTFQTIFKWLFILAFNSSMVLWRSTQVVEETPLERVQVVNSGARVQIPPSPLRPASGSDAGRYRKVLFKRNKKVLDKQSQA